MTESAGRVTIAHSVLQEIARLTTLSVPGVAQFASRSKRRGSDPLRLAAGAGGVRIEVIDNRVEVDVHVIVAPDVNMRDTARAIQSEIARAMNEIVGMHVSNVNVYIQDVGEPAAA